MPLTAAVTTAVPSTTPSGWLAPHQALQRPRCATGTRYLDRREEAHPQAQLGQREQHHEAGADRPGRFGAQCRAWICWRYQAKDSRGVRRWLA